MKVQNGDIGIHPHHTVHCRWFRLYLSGFVCVYRRQGFRESQSSSLVHWVYLFMGKSQLHFIVNSQVLSAPKPNPTPIPPNRVLDWWFYLLPGVINVVFSARFQRLNFFINHIQSQSLSLVHWMYLRRFLASWEKSQLRFIVNSQVPGFYPAPVSNPQPPKPHSQLAVLPYDLSWLNDCKTYHQFSSLLPLDPSIFLKIMDL